MFSQFSSLAPVQVSFFATLVGRFGFDCQVGGRPPSRGRPCVSI